MDTDTLLRRFEREYLEVNSISAHRREVQHKVLRRLAAGLDHDLDRLTPQDLRVFLGSEIHRGLHVNTVWKHLNMVRSFITWAADAGLIEPLRNYELKSVPKPRGATNRQPPRPYKATEIHALYAQLGTKYPVLPEYGRGSHELRLFLRGRSPRLRRHLWRYAKRDRKSVV